MMTAFILAQIQDGPQQVRTRERLERALGAAAELLVESGPELTSIPEIEKRSGVPRTAIYRYFPDKYALFSTMAAGYMEQLGSDFMLPDESEGGRQSLWQEVLATAIRYAAAFYNANPVASVLIFSGPFSARDRAAHTCKASGLVGTLQAQMHGKFSEEALSLTIEITFSCFRYGYFRDGHVSDGMAAEAIRAATGYLSATSMERVATTQSES